MNMSFVGSSEYLVATSWGSKPQLSVWNMSKLSISWSYLLHVEGETTHPPLSLQSCGCHYGAVLNIID